MEARINVPVNVQISWQVRQNQNILQATPFPISSSQFGSLLENKPVNAHYILLVYGVHTLHAHKHTPLSLD